MAMSEDRLKQIGEMVDAATPGPWQWYGNTKQHQVYLSTVHSGRRFILTFERWGMQDAQPLFQVHHSDGCGIMTPVTELAEFEVDHRRDFVGINHPDAKLIAESQTIISELLDEVLRLRAEVATDA